jgi:hypothetical protein
MRQRIAMNGFDEKDNNQGFMRFTPPGSRLWSPDVGQAGFSPLQTGLPEKPQGIQNAPNQQTLAYSLALAQGHPIRRQGLQGILQHRHDRRVQHPSHDPDRTNS